MYKKSYLIILFVVLTILLVVGSVIYLSKPNTRNILANSANKHIEKNNAGIAYSNYCEQILLADKISTSKFNDIGVKKYLIPEGRFYSIKYTKAGLEDIRNFINNNQSWYFNQWEILMSDMLGENIYRERVLPTSIEFNNIYNGGNFNVGISVNFEISLPIDTQTTNKKILKLQDYLSIYKGSPSSDLNIFKSIKNICFSDYPMNSSITKDKLKRLLSQEIKPLSYYKNRLTNGCFMIRDATIDNCFLASSGYSHSKGKSYSDSYYLNCGSGNYYAGSIDIITEEIKKCEKEPFPEL